MTNKTTELLCRFAVEWQRYVELKSINQMAFDDISLEITILDAQDRAGKYLPPDFVMAYVGLCKDLLDIPISERVFMPESGKPARALNAAPKSEKTKNKNQSRTGKFQKKTK